MPAKKGASTNSGIVSVDYDYARRRPEPYHDRPIGNDVTTLLGGLMVDVEHDVNQIPDEIVEQAIWAVRKSAWRHECTRGEWEDAPCTHPRHWRDVAQMRMLLETCGLPGWVPGKPRHPRAMPGQVLVAKQITLDAGIDGRG